MSERQQQPSAPPSLEVVRRQRKPVRNVNAEHVRGLTKMELLALAITEHVGTMGFFFIIAGWTFIWLGWNIFAPKPLRFDPPTAFVLWLFLSNLIQILLTPLLMVGQNVLNRHAELRADADYEVNLKAERETEMVLQHLEYQNHLLERILQHLEQQHQSTSTGGATTE